MQEVKRPKKPLIYFYVAMILAILVFNCLVAPYLAGKAIEDVDYGTFMTMTENGEIGKVQIQQNQIVFTDKEESAIYRTGVIEDPGLVERLHASGATFTSEIVEETSPLATLLLSWLLPIVVFVLLGQFMSKKLMDKAGGGAGSMMFNLGKSNAKVYVKSSDGIRFSDVEGVDEAEENLQEIVDYLENPAKYREIGASMPKGVLLVGPPGTGKTMLAKAVAGEANVPFFSMSGSEFVEMFVGMGASKVRDLFRQAKEKAPCIVFIDEIDAIGQKRSGGQYGGNDEREQTLNQLLTEMDGFDGSNGVIILAATNRPESLDPALTRPGRFDRRVPVDLPDLKGREAILKVHAKKIKVADDVDFLQVARMASGASGAELANIVNEAALRAVRDGRGFATQADLEESIEVVIAGYQKKNAILTDQEKKIVAYHEIGHVLVAAKQTNSAPVQKITIIPRTSGALGYTLQVENNDHYLMNKQELENKIATFTGGRAAEELVFGSITTGAANDIEQATKLARAMITRYGMSEDFDMVAMETVTNQYLGGDTSLACSAETQSRIDEQVVELVRKQHEKALNILKDNRGKLDELASYLYEHETSTGEEFMQILNAAYKPQAEKSRSVRTNRAQKNRNRKPQTREFHSRLGAFYHLLCYFAAFRLLRISLLNSLNTPLGLISSNSSVIIKT
jgi:cell division protease FtsH